MLDALTPFLNAAPARVPTMPDISQRVAADLPDEAYRDFLEQEQEVADHPPRQHPVQPTMHGVPTPMRAAAGGDSVILGMLNALDDPESAQKKQAQVNRAAQNATTEAPATAYATASQKEEIIRLLNYPVITRQEKTKMLLNINRLDEERANQAIGRLRKAIDDREQK